MPSDTDDIVCECGALNPRGEDFCLSCGQYLGWVTTSPAPTDPVPAVAETPDIVADPAPAHPGQSRVSAAPPPPAPHEQPESSTPPPAPGPSSPPLVADEPRRRRRDDRWVGSAAAPEEPVVAPTSGAEDVPIAPRAPSRVIAAIVAWWRRLFGIRPPAPAPPGVAAAAAASIPPDEVTLALRQPTAEGPRPRRPRAPTVVDVARPGDVRCPSCRIDNPPDRRYCRRCGTSLVVAMPRRVSAQPVAGTRPRGRSSRVPWVAIVTLTALVAALVLGWLHRVEVIAVVQSVLGVLFSSS